VAIVEEAGEVNFQVTVLKILVSYTDGFALMADLKRDMAIWRRAAATGPSGPNACARE